MGGLFRSLFGGRSGSPAPPEGGATQGPADRPFQAAFRVPGMT